MEIQQSKAPFIVLLAGIGALLLATGLFVGALTAAGSAGNNGAPSAPIEEATPTPPEATPPGEETPVSPTEPTAPPTEIPVEPTATPVPPTATPAPPTATPTPSIDTYKYQSIFRAEGGSSDRNKKSATPIRRLEAEWDNSYRDCPGTRDCIRGRASAFTGAGPGATGEQLEASSLVYNTFTARRANAHLLMDLEWRGSLFSAVGANANAGVEAFIIVRELGSDGKPVKTVPGMPYRIFSEELGLEAIQGIDTLEIDDSRSVSVPLQLNPGATYRVELEITCNTRVAFSVSATACDFWGGDEGVEWTSQVVEYDTGICREDEQGAGCVYRD